MPATYKRQEFYSLSLTFLVTALCLIVCASKKCDEKKRITTTAAEMKTKTAAAALWRRIKTHCSIKSQTWQPSPQQSW